MRREHNRRPESRHEAALAAFRARVINLSIKSPLIVFLDMDGPVLILESVTADGYQPYPGGPPTAAAPFHQRPGVLTTLSVSRWRFG